VDEVSDLRTAAQQALDALIWEVGSEPTLYAAQTAKAIKALRAALEQPEKLNQCGETCERAKLCATCARGLEQDVPETDCGNMEPLAWLESPYGSIRMNTTMRFQFPPQSLKWKIPLYTHPPRREWRGLTEEEISDIFEAKPRYHYPPVCATDREFARAIEQALRSKNDQA
jgi:hypothetical protein